MKGRLLTSREVAEYLGFAPWTILDMVRKGNLPAFKLPSGALRFRPDEIERWLEARRVGQVERPSLQLVEED